MKVRLFDVSVFGQGIGGLIAALVLQRHGTKILVLSEEASESFDPMLCEFLNGFTLKPALKRIGFHPTEVNAMPALDAPLQLIFPKARFDCYGDEKRFARELIREFPQRSEKILQLFKESYGHIEVYQHLFNSRTPFPPDGFFARRQFWKLLEQVCDGRLLKARALADELKSFDVGDDFARAVEAMEVALTNLVSRWTSGTHLAHLLTLVRWEGYSWPSGPVGLRNMLLTKIRERGGVVAKCGKIRKLDFKGRTISGAELDGAEWGEIRWRAAVIGGDPRGLISLAQKEGRFRDWAMELEKLPIYARKAYQVLRLAPEGLPVGMRSQGILIPGSHNGEVPERRQRIRAIRYAVRRTEEAGGKPEVWICVTAFLPPDGERPDASTLAGEIRSHLKTLIPFLDTYLVEEPKEPFSPSQEGSPGDFRQGWVYEAEKPPTLGVCGLSTRTPFKNAFQAGDMVFPGLGLDGEIMAGMHAAHWAAEYLSAERKPI